MKNSHLPSGPEEVKKRYRQLAKQMHPDAGQCKLTPAPAQGRLVLKVMCADRGKLLEWPKNTTSRIE